jgi:hypothetical protein
LSAACSIEEAVHAAVERGLAGRTPPAPQFDVAPLLGLAEHAARQVPGEPQPPQREHRGDQRAPRAGSGAERPVDQREHSEVRRPADVDVAEVPLPDAEQPEHRHDEHDRGGAREQ